MRLKNIARNVARLKALGLISSSSLCKVNNTAHYKQKRRQNCNETTENNCETETENKNNNDNNDKFNNNDDTNNENEKHEYEFTYYDENNNIKSLNCKNTVIYMIDLDVTKVLPTLYSDLIQKFKLPDLLPGGTHCMMNSVNTGGRPFMGPNLYLTPPGSFTHLHQDGHGTVDSGHLYISGCNEVVIFRRMSEERKKHALSILLCGNHEYDAFYG